MDDLTRVLDGARRWMLPSLLLGIGLLALAGCKPKDAAAGGGGGGAPMIAVTFSPVVAADVPQYLDEIGRAVATESVTIQPQINGKIVKIYFQDGADISKGQMLFSIDPRPFQAALDQAEAAVEQAKAQLQLAQSEYRRVQNLPMQAVSQSDIDTRRNAVAVDEALVNAGEAALETAQVNLEYTSITSPIDGRASYRLVDAGNVVNSSGPNGGTNLLVIQRLTPIYISFTVTESDLAQVREYLKAGTLRASVHAPDDANVREGPVTFLDNAVQQGTGTITLRATLDNADHLFWPGQFVQVRLLLRTMKDTPLVPAQAVQIGQQGSYVYVIAADNSVQMRPIVPGQRQGANVAVTSGVSAGERVVVNGQMMLQMMPGMKVNPKLEEPSGGEVAPAGPPAASTATQPAKGADQTSASAQEAAK